MITIKQGKELVEVNITLTGKKISQDERILAFKKDNLTAQMTFTVDTDDSWTYKLDVRFPVKCCTGEELFNIIDLPMDASRTCTIDVTSAMVPFTGKYTMQLRERLADTETAAKILLGEETP